VDIAGGSTVSDIGNTSRRFATAGCSHDFGAIPAIPGQAEAGAVDIPPAILGCADEVMA